MKDVPWLDIPEEELAKGLGYSRPHKPTKRLEPPPIYRPPPKTGLKRFSGQLPTIVKPNFIPGKGKSFPLFAQRIESDNIDFTSFANGVVNDEDYNEPDLHKVDRDACFVAVNRWMNRAATEEELEERVKSFGDQTGRAMYRDYHKKSRCLVDREVELCLLSNQIRLKFIPQSGRPPANTDEFVRGTYEAQVVQEDGKVKNWVVANDWVEDNFSKECLTIVQRVALQSAKVYQDKNSSKTERGYLSLADEPNYNKLKIDERQISQIRYLPPKKKRNLMGEWEYLPHKWKGIIQTKLSTEVEFVLLEDSWIKRNIDIQFRQMLMNLRKEDQKGYVPIPEGDNKTHDSNSFKFLPDAPKAKYYNDNTDTNKRRCVLDSTASGLYHIGFKSLAWHINATKSDRSKDWCAFTVFFNIIQKYSTKEQRKQIQITKVPKRNWDILTEAPKYHLCLLGIQSSDGKMDHAICVVGKWIFDSNFEMALPLTTESLDLCSSSEDRYAKFVSVKRGYYLQNRISHF